MPRWIRDILLPIAVVLALPIGMLGPALTLPALVYGFPLVLLAVLAGLLLLVLPRRSRPAGAPSERTDVQQGPPSDLEAARPDPIPPDAPRPYAAVPLPEGPAGPRAVPALRVSLAPVDGHAGPLAGAARPLAGGPFRRLLVLLDPDDFAPEALERALATARRDGAEIVLVSVMEVEEARRRGPARESLARHPQVLRALIEKALENLCWRIQAGGVKVRRRSELDDPAARVPALAREEGVDAIVVVPRRRRLPWPRPAPPEWAPSAPCPVLALSS